MFRILKEKCQGCGLCVEVCPKKLLVLNKEEINERGHTPAMITDEKSCTHCTLCAIMCPDCVIQICDK